MNLIFILQTRDMSQASLYSWLVSLEWVRAWFLVFWDGNALANPWREKISKAPQLMANCKL
jgi:hypothetical protein